MRPLHSHQAFFEQPTAVVMLVVMLVGTYFVLKVRTLCLLCLMVPASALLVLPVILFHLLPSVPSAIVLTQSKAVPSVAKETE
jgi:hypothetical protein